MRIANAGSISIFSSHLLTSSRHFKNIFSMQMQMINRIKDSAILFYTHPQKNKKLKQESHIKVIMRSGTFSQTRKSSANTLKRP